MSNINAVFYDGLSTRQQPISLSMVNGLVLLQGEGFVREFELDKTRISAKLGDTPRLLHFADGSHCEVQDQTGFNEVLEAAGITPLTLLAHLENSWFYALAATLLVISFVISMFYWGLPFMASKAAERVPDKISLAIDTQVLSAFDDGLTETSKLSAKRRDAISRRFDTMRKTDKQLAAHLEFRYSKNIGANAFALPGGTIIVTDQLVKLARNDEEILAVLAHELGHVSERHPLRQMLQSSVVGLAMTWYLGDISSLLALAPTVLLESSYSRNFERRADHYAATMLRQNKIATTRLADILEKLESSHTGHKPKQESTSPLFELFSSHPDTAERIRALRSTTAD